MNDADISNMVYYNSGYDIIYVFMVEHDSPLSVLACEVAEIQGQQSMGNSMEDTNIRRDKAEVAGINIKSPKNFQHDLSGSCSSDESYQPSRESVDVEICDDSDLHNISWLYEDFEGDEDDVFNNGTDGDHGGLGEVDVGPSGGNNDCGFDDMEGSNEAANLTEDVKAEFNEHVHYEDDLHNLQGSNDDMRQSFIDFNDHGDIKNSHLEIGMRFSNSNHTCFRDALRAWAIARGCANYFSTKQNNTWLVTSSVLGLTEVGRSLTLQETEILLHSKPRYLW